MTTTDPFTDAASDAADRAARTFIGSTDAAYGYSIGYTDGAEWGRDYALAAREPSSAEVDAGMVAAAQSMPAEWWGGTEWQRYVEEILTAARTARRDEETR